MFSRRVSDREVSISKFLSLRHRSDLLRLVRPRKLSLIRKDRGRCLVLAIYAYAFEYAYNRISNLMPAFLAELESIGSDDPDKPDVAS